MDFNIYLSRLKNAWNKSSILPITKQGNTTIKNQSEEDIKLSKNAPKKVRQKKPKEKKAEAEKKKRVPQTQKKGTKKASNLDIKKKRKTSVKKPRVKKEKPKKQKILKTALREKYMKQRARIQQIIRKAKKEGLTFDDNFLDILPKRIPRRVTQRMFDKLKNIKPRDIHKRGYFLDTETGEIIEGIAYVYDKRKQKREAKKVAKKVFKRQIDRGDIDIASLPTIENVDMVIERIRHMFSRYGHTYDNLKSICIKIIQDHMAEHPKEYRQYIIEQREEISQCIKILYEPSDQETIEITSERLVTILNMHMWTLELSDMLVDYVYE